VRDTVGVEAVVDFAAILEGLLEGVVVVDAGSIEGRRPATVGGIESFVGSDMMIRSGVEVNCHSTTVEFPLWLAPVYRLECYSCVI